MFQISRRDLVLGASAAYATFGLSKPIAFIGAAEAQQMPPGPGFKKYNVGDIEVFSLYDGPGGKNRTTKTSSRELISRRPRASSRRGADR
jgi:hypothetical protein